MGAVGIVRESAGILLEGVPSHIDTKRIAKALSQLPGVTNVHDLHVWGLDAHLPSLTCHVLMKEGGPTEIVLRTVRQFIAKEFGIHHMTIQVEAACCHPNPLHCKIRSAYETHPVTATILSRRLNISEAD